MKEFIPDQLRAVSAFFLSGAALGFIRDVFRFFGMIAGVVPVPERPKRNSGAREKKSPPAAVRFTRCAAVFSADVFFWLVAAVVFAVMTFAFCGGRFRAYSFFSAAGGFYLYSLFPGKVFRIPFEFAALRIRRLICAAARFAAVPLWRLVRATAGFIARPALLYLKRVSEARRLKRSKKQKGKDNSLDDARVIVFSAGRRKTF